MKDRRRTLSVLAACMLLASLLAGCGGDQQAPASQQQPAASSATPLASGPAIGAMSPSSSATETAVAAAVATEVAIIDQATGQSTPASQSGGMDLSNLDPCALLTREEVEAVMGPVKYNPQPKPFSVLGEIDCTFVQMESLESPYLQVTVMPPEDWEYKTTELAVDGTPVEAPGIGDEAVTTEMKEWQHLMALLKGRAIVTVRIIPKDVEDAKQIAAKVIERLP